MENGEFDPADYSLTVKRRGSPAKPWRREIYCPCKTVPVERSPGFFESMRRPKKGKRLSHACQRDRALTWAGCLLSGVKRTCGELIRIHVFHHEYLRLLPADAVLLWQKTTSNVRFCGRFRG
jgi:hypothetical protein